MRNSAFKYCITLTLSVLVLSTSMVGARASENVLLWGEIKDLNFGTTLYHFYQRQYFQSIVHLTANQNLDRIKSHKAEAELLLGGMYLSYGMHHEATKTLDKLLNNKKVKPDIKDRALFYLGKIRFQRGYINEALQSLQLVGSALPAELREQHKVLLANIYLSKGEYKKALKVLKEINGDTPWSVYGKYNMGVAFIRLGQNQRGIGLLEEVGSMKAVDEEMKSLRDKANTVLGYSYLKDNRPDDALKHLSDVRLNGLLANKALLGTGWAYSSKEKYKKALVYWTELQKHDVFDSALQESLLAVPYSLANLDANNQAIKKYNEAITAYEAERQRLNFSMQAIQSGKLIKNIHDIDVGNEEGWFYALNNLPNSPESHYLIRLMSGHTFQEALKNYRDVRFLGQHLGKLEDDLDTYKWMVAARRHSYESRLSRILKHFRDLNSGELDRKRNALAAEISRVEKDRDLKKLATNDELKKIVQIDKLEKRANNVSKFQNVDKERNKLRILRGVIFWRIYTEYKKRLWNVKSGMKELDKALRDSRKAAAAVEKARKTAPLTFEGFDSRLARYKKILNNLKSKLRLLGDMQAKYIEKLAVAGLQQKQHRLETYLIQARFGIAQIIDKSSRVVH